VLWELDDPDLGDTWSSPDLGAIRVREGDREVLKYVAVFGGGMDPAGRLRESEVTLGRMLYMVDVETGAVLYKRQLAGAVPSAPAAVDTDRDGVLDRVYVGTTEGLLYRVDLDVPAALGPGGVTDKRWEPYVIFDTASGTVDGGVFVPDPATRKPIFFPPSVIFSSRLGRYALAFGTGNRENLWAPEQPTGNRFYLFLDDSDVLDPADPPRSEHDLEEVTSQEGVGRDLLQDLDDGHRGWYIRLGTAPSSGGLDVTGERVLGPATAISGVNVFTTFVPATAADGGLCTRRGASRVYTQLTSNGEEVPMPDGGPASGGGSAPPECLTPPCTRQPVEVEGLVSELFLEETGQPCVGMEGMAELLKKRIFPPQCSFASYRWTLSALREDTGMECLAEIPVCVIEKNWKDF
jgi:type IV pilus assembly protein PilY1